MKTKALAAAAILAAGLPAAGSVWLADRYPAMSLPDSFAYVVNRVGTLAKESLLVSTPYDAREPLAVELANVRQIALAMEPNLSGMEPLPRALALRDLVYRKVPVKPAPTGFDYNNLDKAVFLELSNDEYGDICGGLSIVYLTLLKAFDIEARYVGMFKEVTEATDPVVSHASVDVLLDGEWIALDPTFNFSIWAEGQRIGWEAARERALANDPITFASDGYAILPGRNVYDYSDPLPDSMDFMILAPVGESALTTLPEQWDGSIRYASGNTFDQRQSLYSSPVYVRLAE